MPSKHKNVRLPYSDELARAYEALDLPFGAPMETVTPRWLDYLAQCRKHYNPQNPDLFSDAFKLTHFFNHAHKQIESAWISLWGRIDQGLPRSPEVARAYEALDLPYGVPMAEVTRQWKNYLKKCHPDLQAGNPERIKEANRLTAALTAAYEKIKTAWQYYLGN